MQEKSIYRENREKNNESVKGKRVIHLNADTSGKGILWDGAHSGGLYQDVSLEYDVLKLQKKVLDSLGFVDCDVERVYSDQEMMSLGQVQNSDVNYGPHHVEDQEKSVINDRLSYHHVVNGSSEYQYHQRAWNVPNDAMRGRMMTQSDWPALGCEAPGQELVTPGKLEVAEEECLVGIHGQYQSYCHQIITPKLNEATVLALTKLKNLQIAMDANIIPGLAKGSQPKKYYCSLKEVSKVAKTCKLLVIAPDVKPSPTAHIKPVRMLLSVIEDAAHAGVPYIFALSRRGIGQIFGKDKHMSIMALMSLDHIEEECAIMIREATYGRTLFHSYAAHNNSKNNFFYPGQQ